MKKLKLVSSQPGKPYNGPVLLQPAEFIGFLDSLARIIDAKVDHNGLRDLLVQQWKEFEARMRIPAPPQVTAEEIIPSGGFVRELLITPKHVEDLFDICWALGELEDIGS